MDLIALAIPFFLLALLVELAVDRWRGTGFYRSNDAISSLSAGTVSTTLGYFTKLLPVYLSGIVASQFALFDIDPAWFDLSATGLAWWLLAILGWDFCYYWAHRCGHEISVLWAAHAVHHQSEDYNLSTALRQTSTGFLFGWVFYLPLFLLGFPVEVIATANALDLIYQFWVHTRHIGRLGWMDYVCVTPSNHRVHHAQNERYIDKNYGGILILWDRLFGTFQDELDEEPVTFGVRKPLASWNPFWANLQVYDYLWFDAKRTRRWRDKLGIWFRRTGWRPADVASAYPAPMRALDSFQQYDPPVAPAVQRYVIGQFLVAAIAVLWIGSVFAADGAMAVLTPCLLLWITLFNLGALNESKPSAVSLEKLRLIAITPAAAVLFHTLGVTGAEPATLAAMAGVYVSASLVALGLATRQGSGADAGRSVEVDTG